jgi:hypothetical protein
LPADNLRTPLLTMRRVTVDNLWARLWTLSAAGPDTRRDVRQNMSTACAKKKVSPAPAPSTVTFKAL